MCAITARAPWISSVRRYTCLHQSLARSVYRQQRLLLCRLHRDEAHIRPRHRLADRLGIVAVALVRLHVRLYKLWRHQTHRMAQFPELPRPVVRAATGFHADQARLEIGEEAQHVLALELLA